MIKCPWKRAGPFICRNLNPLYSRVLCARSGWNWNSGSGDLSMYFHYFIIISPWKRVWPFIWTNLNPLHPRMHYAKFGWNWPCGSGEDDFLNFVNLCLLFCNYLPWKRTGPSFEQTLIPFYPRMLCAKFG